MLGWAVTRLRWVFWTAFYRLAWRGVFTEIGPGCWFEGWIDIPQRPGELRVGRGVRIAAGVTITVGRGAKVRIGDDVFVGRGCMISAHELVDIGRRSMLAAYVSLHDNDHVFDPDGRGVSTESVKQPIVIGEGCWLGTHAVVVRGGGLGDRCVLGAGAILTRVFPSGTKAAGVPARAIEGTRSEHSPHIAAVERSCR